MTVVVVGGGPAGLAAALQARQFGCHVTLLEADRVGGTSLNRGPAPVRTLARAARLARDWSSWEGFGLRGPPPRVDVPALRANALRVAAFAHERTHLAQRVRSAGVDLVDGCGPVRFDDPHTLAAADGRKWQAEQIVLAVGGRAARLPVAGGELALGYEDLLALEALPASAAVVGGADTGCQLASILADFGVRVEVFENAPVLLAHADPEVSAGMQAAFEARGLAVRTSTWVERLDRAAGRRAVAFRGPDGTRSITVDAVFAAVGWPANTDELELARAGVAAERGAVAVDARLRTNVEHIFAAGDLTGHHKLVQVARMEGRVAGQNAAGGPERVIDYATVPAASFTDPEYGQVGLTEPAARAARPAVVAVAHHRDLLRPVADGRPEGFCKLIVDRERHSVLGAHVLGEYSAEIVQVAAIAMAGRMTVEELAAASFAFPTFTEAVGMAAHKACRMLGLGPFPRMWSDLEWETEPD